MSTHSISGAEIFSVGTHNDISFSLEDLQAIAQAFTQMNSAARVPLKFGHNDEQPMTDGQPALGWVDRVWVEGKKLLADFVGMPTVVYNAISKGLYKHVSIELLQNYSREGSSYPWVLDAVALLGADIPAVRDLKDLQSLAMTRSLSGVRFDKSCGFTSAGVLFKLEDNDMATVEELQAQLAAANAKVKELADKDEAREKQLFAERVSTHRSKVVGLLESAVKEGRIDARIRNRIEGSRQFKSDADVMEVWTEAEVKAEIEANTRADFKQADDKVQSRVHTNDSKETKMDFTGRTNAEVVTLLAQEECKRVGQDPLNTQHLTAATRNVFARNPNVARAYFDAPAEQYKPADDTSGK